MSEPLIRPAAAVSPLWDGRAETAASSCHSRGVRLPMPRKGAGTGDESFFESSREVAVRQNGTPRWQNRPTGSWVEQEGQTTKRNSPPDDRTVPRKKANGIGAPGARKCPDHRRAGREVIAGLRIGRFWQSDRFASDPVPEPSRNRRRRVRTACLESRRARATRRFPRRTDRRQAAR